MDWGYIGGFIDAEGTVFRKGYLRRISICNTCLHVLEAIKEFIGYGRIYKRDFNGKNHFGKKPVYVLDLTRKGIAKELSGHVVVKKETIESLFGVKLEKPKISWSYVAGFFDGEGSITLYPKSAAVVFSNKSILALRMIRNFLGYGHIYAYRNQCVRLRINNHEKLLEFCNNTMRHSIVKKDEILALKKFIEKKEWWANRKLKNVSKETFEKLYWLQNCSIRQIARIFGVTYNAVWRKLNQFEISRRSYREANQHARRLNHSPFLRG